MRFPPVLAASLVLVIAGTAQAQLIDLRTIKGKQVACMHSGLSSSLSDCGFHSDWYTYVFVGSIVSITPAEKNESQLEILPEEVFFGKPPATVTVLTSQGQCLPPLVAGEKWLFYLRKEKDKPIPLDYYGNISAPVAKAQKILETLRRLQALGDFALLRGRAYTGDFGAVGMPLAGAAVIARRKSDGGETSTTTGKDGRYEFPPLIPGEYTLKAQAGSSSRPADDSEVTLKRDSCWDVTLYRPQHTRISGHITRSNGSPVASVGVVLIAADNTSYLTSSTDEKGHFSFDEESPGDYVVGINFPARKDWVDGAAAGSGLTVPPASLYYPGFPERAAAHVISLKTDEKLNHIDFMLPVKQLQKIQPPNHSR